MFYANAKRASEGGQAQRDRVRILPMEKDGYDVYTVDNTHHQEQGEEGRHLHCNACSPRFMVSALSPGAAHAQPVHQPNSHPTRRSRPNQPEPS